MIDLKLQRKLNKSALSGLIRFQEKFYAIADDELSLISFTELAEDPIKEYELFPGELPKNFAERKKAKPDFESLLLLTSMNCLLAIPSGSKQNRCRGALFDLKTQRVQKIDFSDLFLRLQAEIADLNIEGAIEFGEEIRLFHRGNAKDGQNRVIRLQHNIFMKELVSCRMSSTSLIESVICNLGYLKKIPLAFTDAAPLKTQELIVFLAVAEKTESTYDDGEYAGAVIGFLDKNHQIVDQQELLCPFKPEGLSVEGRDFWVVTDADDRTQVSNLYKGHFNTWFK